MRALKDGLSGALRRVSAGSVIEVTDHGRPVARLVPADMPEHLVRLIADGTVTPPTTLLRLPSAKDRLDLGPGISASDLLIEDRRDRI